MSSDSSALDLPSGKAEELFSYLLLHKDRPSSREALASMLWGYTTTSVSKAYLRRTLWQLRSAFREQLGASSEAVLTAEPEWIQLNPAFDLWTDVASFDQVHAQTVHTPVERISDDQVQALRTVVELYKGDLLENYYQEWCLVQRERYRYLFLAMLDKLTTVWMQRERYDVAASVCERILTLDPARERSHRQLMRLRYLAGDRTGALHQYERCVDVLDENFGVSPAASTKQLYDQIRAGTSIASTGLSADGSTTSAGLLKSKLGEVQGMLDEVSDIQDQLRQKLDALAGLIER